MTYTPINWQTGDTITAEKMNKMDNGWSVTNSVTTICDETVTTYVDGSDNAAQLTIASAIEADSIVVTYDNTVYTCTNDGDMYGAPYGDYSQYPFTIYSDGFMICETAGTHSVKIEATATVVELSQSFADAVSAALPIMQIIINKTSWQQAYDALAAGKLLYYIADVDENHVIQFVVSQAYYDYEQDKYEVYGVGVENGAVTNDVLFAESSNGALLRY